MATLKDFRDERLRKLDELKALGINSYPAKTERTHRLAQIIDQFDDLKGKSATIVGRITGIRKFGKLAFIVIRDDSGSLQLFLHAPDVAELDPTSGLIGMKQLNLLA